MWQQFPQKLGNWRARRRSAGLEEEEGLGDGLSVPDTLSERSWLST